MTAVLRRAPRRRLRRPWSHRSYGIGHDVGEPGPPRSRDTSSRDRQQLHIAAVRYSLVADHWQYTALPGVLALACGTAGGWLRDHSGASWRLAAAPGVLVAALWVRLFPSLARRDALVMTRSA